MNIEALDRAIKYDTPYTPNISEIWISCNRPNWEYPNNSQGKPEKIKERIYSIATHTVGIIAKKRIGFLARPVRIIENEAIKSARTAESRNNNAIDSYQGRFP